MVANSLFSSLCIRFDCCRQNSNSAQSQARLGCTGLPIALGGLPDVRLRGCRPDQGAFSDPAISAMCPCHDKPACGTLVGLRFQVCLVSSWASVIRGPTSCCVLCCGLRPGPCFAAILCLMGYSNQTTPVPLRSTIVSTLLPSSCLSVARTLMVQHAHGDTQVVNSAAAVWQYMPIFS